MQFISSPNPLCDPIWTLRSSEIGDKYNTVKFKVKYANGTAVTLQSAVGKRLKTDES